MREGVRALQQRADIGEPLHQELTGYSRLRIGELRLIYSETPQALRLVAIGPRRTIYRLLELAARPAAKRE